MRSLKSIIFLLIIAVGCSSPEEKNYDQYQGVWKRIGTVKYENQVAVDTFFFPEGKVIPNRREPEVSVTGARYKVYADGHTIWFYSRDGYDKGPDGYAKLTYSMRNDSLFETFKGGFWHDKFSKSPNINRLMNEGYKAKISIDGDIYTQVRMNPNGKFSYGEIYKRIDTYNVNPTNLTGTYNRISTIRIRNGKKSDTIDWGSSTGKNIGAFQIVADSKRMWAFNFESLDSLGKDRNPGSVLLSNYKINGDIINDTLIWATNPARNTWSRLRNNKRTRNFELNDGKYGIITLDENKNGQIAIFEKQ